MSEIKVKLLSHWGPGDQRTCESAWTSTYDRDKFETKTEEQIDKVIDIVVGHGHGTPLESTWMEFYLEIPIYIERQIDKYRTTQQYQDIQIEYQFAPMNRDGITQNELSARYRTLPNRFIEMPDDVEEILETKKEPRLNNSIDRVEPAVWYHNLMESQYNTYINKINELKDWVKEGSITQADYKRAREFLRGILGTAFITHMKLVLNLRAFENILRERLAPDAQPEIQQVAKLMLLEVIKNRVAPKVIDKMCHTNSWSTDAQIAGELIMIRYDKALQKLAE